MAEIAVGVALATAVIEQDHQQREAFAVGVKAEVKRRQCDVRGLLTSLRTARRRAGVEYSRQAGAVLGQRRSAVKTLLTQLERDRHETATAQREDATAFTRDLTSDVAAFLRQLDTANADRAFDVECMLRAFACDRHQVELAWIG
jgi:hypothetical protein